MLITKPDHTDGSLYRTVDLEVPDTDPARDVRLGGDERSRLHVVNLGADGLDPPRDLVAERHRHAGHAALCPFVKCLDLLEGQIHGPIGFAACFLENAAHAHTQRLADLVPLIIILEGDELDLLSI